MTAMIIQVAKSDIRIIKFIIKSKVSSNAKHNMFSKHVRDIEQFKLISKTSWNIIVSHISILRIPTRKITIMCNDPTLLEGHFMYLI